MDKAHKKDYLQHLESLGMKDSAEYKSALAKKCSDENIPKTKK